MFTLKLKVGNGMLEFQSTSYKEIHEISAVYGGLPSKCDNCSSKEIYLSHKNPKGNDFYTLRCKDCGAELQIHLKKEGGGCYLKFGEKMEVYQKTEGVPAQTGQREEPDIQLDDSNPFGG